MPDKGKAHLLKSFRMVLPAAAILIAGVVVLLGLLIYRVSHPEPSPEPVNPTHYSLPALEVSIPAGGENRLPAWWIPGLKGAPGIILAPGYGMSRSDAMSLAAALHEKGYNILVYSQRGCGPAPASASTLGLREAGDMAQAVRLIQDRPEGDRARLGIWGVDIGALAALRTAASFPEVLAIVADSPYESESDFFACLLADDFGLGSRILSSICYQAFRLTQVFNGSLSSRKLPVKELSGRAILFIKGENRKNLAELTNAIYDQIQPQKEMISFKAARVRAMSGEELMAYDRQVANFFSLNLR